VISLTNAVENPHSATAQSEYRQLMSTFPTGVAVVTTLDDRDRPAGLTCSSLTSVTLAPPTLLICVHSRSRAGLAVVERGSFIVNLLHSRARGAAEIFASPHSDRFQHVEWAPSRTLGLPWLIDDAHAVAECRISETRVIGDHRVIFGEVAAIDQRPDLPLLYGLRRFSFWGGPA
jgi:flavin reductase (DIM6/NTAB) family NADH-FMN oxidoreductase RutF